MLAIREAWGVINVNPGKTSTEALRTLIVTEIGTFNYVPGHEDIRDNGDADI